MLLPSEYLLQATPADMEQLLDDSASGFVFYVEIDLNADVARQLPLITGLLPQLSAVVLKGRAPPTPMQVREIFQSSGDNIVLYYYNGSERGDNAAFSVAQVFTPLDSLAEQQTASNDYIALLNAGAAVPILQLKSEIERLIKSNPDAECRALFAVGDSPNLEKLREASQLYALMV